MVTIFFNRDYVNRDVDAPITIGVICKAIWQDHLS